MKLITALCDALGFDVEEGCVNQDSIRQSEAGNLARLRGGCFGYGGAAIEPRYQIEPIYEYKLTKRIEKELTPDEKAVEDYILRNEAMLTKRVESKIPKKFIDDNLKKAKGSTMFDMPLEDLTKEELMCCVVFSWDKSKKARDAANNQNDLDLARSFRGKA